MKWFMKKEQKKEASLQNVRIELQKQAFSAYRREIEHWQWARNLRYATDCPLTYAMQEVYKDTMLDAHLSAVINNRMLRMINKHYVIRDAEGVVSKEKSRYLEGAWFHELLGYVMESIFYGYSLMHIDKKNGQITVELVDRRHVVPERRAVLKQMHDRSGGLTYTQFPEELLYAQLGEPIGLLERAAPLTILKRHSWANWDEFEQIFGLPIRIARVPSMETKDTQHIASWLEEMGTAAYAILPDSAQVEVKESRRADAHEVFKEKILCVNAEISKLINGQTMTVDSGSSRSQSEVHLRTEQAAF